MPNPRKSFPVGEKQRDLNIPHLSPAAAFHLGRLLHYLDAGQSISMGDEVYDAVVKIIERRYPREPEGRAA